MAACADEVELVVVVGADEGGGYEAVTIVGDFGHEAVGVAAAVGGLDGAGGGGEVAAVGAAADEEVVGGVDVDGVDGVVAGAAEVGAPEEVAQVVVEFEDDAVLPSATVCLQGIGADGEVGAEGGGAEVDVVEVVGDDFAAGAVAVVVVERVVALHGDEVVVVVVVAVVESVVAGAADVGGCEEGGAVGAEAGDEDVAAVGVGDGGGEVVDGHAAGEGGLEGGGGDGEVGGAGGAEDDEFVEGVDEEAVRHVAGGAAEVGGVEALGAEGVEFEDADVEDEAGGVGVLFGVVGGGGAPVVGDGAGVGGEDEHGVDDQFEFCIVGTQGDGGHAVAHFPARWHFHLLAAQRLIGVGFQFDHVAHGGAHHEVAFAVDA